MTAPATAVAASTVTPSLAVAGSATGAISTKLNSSMCLTVQGGTATNGAPVVLGSCTGGESQQWTRTAAGEFRIYGDKCLDAYGARGNNGDKLVIWDCWDGAANQKWTPNELGEIRGINGKCVDLYRSSVSDGTPVVIWQCWDKAANQKWNVGAGDVVAAPEPAPTAPTEAPAPSPVTVAGCSSYPAARVVAVATAAQLSSALAGARPGDRIELADGTYRGAFAASASGTSTQPIVLCGGRNAVLDAGTTSSADGLTLKGSYWTLSGFTVTNALRGIIMQRASYNRLTGLLVHGIGQEAIHLHVFSSNNTIENSEIRNTGLKVAEYGEGVYIGTYRGQWGSYTGGQPDQSDNNRVVNNRIGPDVRAEGIDVKEGTTGGLIQGNTFDGRGMVQSKDWVDSWVELKGNSYQVIGNRGTNAIRDGFQTFQELAGWGNNNVFRGNTADVQASGYGIRATNVSGTIVGCDNVVTNAGAGLSNVSCQ